MINTKHGRFTSAFWRFLGVFLLSVPMGSNAVEISNGVPEGTVGHYRVDVQTGGDTRTAVVTAKGLESGSVLTVDVVFDYSSFVDPGIDGQAFRLSDTAETGPTQDPNTPNVVSSSGSFMAANGNMILWTGISTIQPGSPVFQTRYTFSTDDGRPLGPLRVL